MKICERTMCLSLIFRKKVSFDHYFDDCSIHIQYLRLSRVNLSVLPLKCPQIQCETHHCIRTTQKQFIEQRTLCVGHAIA